VTSTVLVTGGAGFIGRPLAARLRDLGHEVISADRVEGTLPGVRHERLDVTDADAVHALVARTRPDRIVHTAAVVGVAASVGGGLMPTVQVNIAGSVNLFEAALAVGGVQRIVDLSSEEYYGHFVEEPLPETARAEPISPYGISKLAVERLAGYYADTAGLPYVAARLQWVYGPDFPRHRLPEPWLRDAVAGRSSRIERGGDQRIDFTHLDDVLQGIELLLEAETLEHRAYNVATGSAVSIRELADALHRIRPDWSVEVGGGRLELAPGVDAAVKGSYDIGRIREELGYEPRVSLEAGLRACLAAIEAEQAG
jgi:nucleoside-diphosphate-sugar epimerase